MRSLVECVFNQVCDKPEGIALIEGNNNITYRELWGKVTAYAKSFKQKGIVSGDHFALCLDNSFDYVAAYYASLLSKIIVVPINTAFKPSQICTLLKHANVKAALAYKNIIDRCQPIAPNSIDWLELEVDRPESIADPIDNGFSIGEDACTNELATIIYTSGTTGNPKGVMLSDKNLATNSESIVNYLGLTRRDIVMCVLPFYYSYGNSVLHTHLSVGATVVIESQFMYPHTILEKMINLGVTGFSGVPATFSLLLQRCELHQYKIPSLRYATCAGGPITKTNVHAILAAWPKIDFFVMYGQTEATARLAYNPPERLLEKIDSIGISIPGVTLSVQNEKGESLEPGQRGEICAKGPNIMLGYWKDKSATREKIKYGWLRTGDIGVQDKDGYFRLLGRNSEMIKTGAHRVSPEEIEEVISEIKGVKEVAVCGVADSLLGEAILAYVVPEECVLLETNEILSYCNQHLPRYKLPKKVIFTSEIPKTASGKLQRFKLVDKTPIR